MISFFYPPQPSRIWPTSPLLTSLKHPDWDAEIKYNGWRVLVFKLPDKVALFNRHGTIIDIDWKPFWKLFSSVPNNTVFDGELLDRRTKDLKNVIVLWDVAFFNGRDLRAMPLQDRRPFLETFPVAPTTFRTQPTGQVFRTQQFPLKFRELYDSIVAHNDDVEEGIVLKKRSSIYRTHPSRKIEVLDWLKVKKIGDHARVSEEN
jgi:ATP-dependent DNA ligase